MTVYELIEKTRKTEPCYFDHSNLKFFGETLSSMKVLKEHATITDHLGEKHDCIVLSSLQRNYPRGPRRSYSYFDCTTWRRIMPREA